MRIVPYGLRPAVLAALRHAAHGVGVTAGLELRVQPVGTRPAFASTAPDAGLVVVDLEHVRIQDALEVLTELLLVSPFTRVVAINTLLTRSQEQALLFELGKISVGDLIDGDRAIHAPVWQAVLEDLTGLDVLREFYRALRPLVPPDARGAFLLDLARVAHASSIKELVAALDPDPTASPTTKRHRLWSRCAALGLPAPEDVHDALRLVLLKALLDDGTWSTDRLAAYLGHGTSKNLTRSCRARYGLGLAAIKAYDANRLHLAVGAVFFDGQPLSIRPNQAVPDTNQDVL